MFLRCPGLICAMLAVFTVINEEKNGKPNYVGANSFAEIAMGFYFGKTVFLKNDIYEPFADELVGWGVIPLKGNLDAIKEYK